MWRKFWTKKQPPALFVNVVYFRVSYIVYLLIKDEFMSCHLYFVRCFFSGRSLALTEPFCNDISYWASLNSEENYKMIWETNLVIHSYVKLQIRKWNIHLCSIKLFKGTTWVFLNGNVSCALCLCWNAQGILCMSRICTFQSWVVFYHVVYLSLLCSMTHGDKAAMTLALD